MKLFNWDSNIEQDLNMIYRSIEELENKMGSLYKRDYHGFLRPKVDILADNTNDTECAVWESMSKLEKRIEELEGKKK